MSDDHLASYQGRSRGRNKSPARALRAVISDCRLDPNRSPPLGGGNSSRIGEGSSMQRFASFFLIAVAFASTAWPQASSSTVRGAVRDQGQAVVPRAKVTL